MGHIQGIRREPLGQDLHGGCSYQGYQVMRGFEYWEEKLDLVPEAPRSQGPGF